MNFIMKRLTLLLTFALPLVVGAQPVTVNGPSIEITVGIRGAVELEFTTAVNEYYQVEISADDSTWDNEGYAIKGTGGTVSTVVSTRNWETAFYRVTDGADPNNIAPAFTASAPVSIDSNNVIGLNPASNGSILRSNGTNWVAEQIPVVTLDNMQPWLGINFIIALYGTYPSRNSSNPFIAQVIMFAGTFAPRNWAYCDGQLLPISSNSALFSLLGTTYGGDGRTTFALPDMRGRVPVHPGTGPGLTNRRLGAKGGSETTAHTH